MPVASTLIPVPGVVLPALYAGSPSQNNVAIVLHGLGVSKEVQIPELQRLKSIGFHAVSVDAPHHGQRDDGYLALMERQSSEYDKHLLLLKIILQQSAEVEALIGFFRAQNKKVAVIGISMGGFCAFSLLGAKTQPDFCAPFLASPDFRCPRRPIDLPESLLEKCGPVDITSFRLQTRLFIVNAGQDKIVDGSASAEFAASVKADKKADLTYLNYVDSDHFMRAADWYDAWDKLTTQLTQAPF
jgi:predicted esterase